jgi:hypothetical protein
MRSTVAEGLSFFSRAVHQGDDFQLPKSSSMQVAAPVSSEQGFPFGLLPVQDILNNQVWPCFRNDFMENYASTLWIIKTVSPPSKTWQNVSHKSTSVEQYHPPLVS